MLGVELIMFESIFYIIIRDKRDGSFALVARSVAWDFEFSFSPAIRGEEIRVPASLRSQLKQPKIKSNFLQRATMIYKKEEEEEKKGETISKESKKMIERSVRTGRFNIRTTRMVKNDQSVIFLGNFVDSRWYIFSDFSNIMIKYSR